MRAPKKVTALTTTIAVVVAFAGILVAHAGGSKITLFMQRTGCGTSNDITYLTLSQTGTPSDANGCGDLFAAAAANDVAGDSETYTAKNALPAPSDTDGLPTVLDSTNPITGRLTVEDFFSLVAGSGAGVMTVDFTVAGSIGGGSPQTIGTASVSKTILPTQSEATFDYSINLPAALNGQQLTALALTVYVHGPAAGSGFIKYNGDSFLNVPSQSPPPSPPPPPPTPTLGPDAPHFQNLSPSPCGDPACDKPGYQTKDVLQRANAGEPSLGLDWKTGAAMYMAGTQISKVTFDDTKNPPTATWTDVTPASQSVVNEDAILSTDPTLGHTVAEGLLLAGSNGATTDDDGATWRPASFPVPHGPDHETVGQGPYANPVPPTAGAAGDPHAVYYCSQNILIAAGAFCGRSDTGGTTYNPSSHLFGTGTPCGSIHGHVKVGPDGTVYVPQESCKTSNKDSAGNTIVGQGMAVSSDNGFSWSYSVVPDSLSGPTDPSVGIGADNTVYFGYEDGSGHPKIAVSHDHGQHWSPSVDVGLPWGIQRSKFPEVVAGDGNRAAFAFLGTTTAGDDQSSSFRGTWYLYVAFTYDGGQTWTTVNATPGDPVQRGCIWNGGGGNACRNLLDFNDIGMDKNGRVLVGYTDGCANINYSYQSLTGQAEGLSAHGPSQCDTNANAFADTDKVSFDGLVRQDCGKGLLAAYDPGFTTGCASTSTPSPTPAPSTSASPTPGPTPSATPTPSPTPSATPTPSPTPTTPCPSLTQASATPNFSLACVGPKNRGGEPSIATGPEGNLYVSYPGGGMNFFRSKDSGATWQAGATKANTRSGDTSVNVDSSGAVYQTDLAGSGGPNALQADVYKSLDQGDRWTRGVGFASSGSASNQPLLVDRQWADAYIPPSANGDTSKARVYLTYHDFGPSQVWVNVSTDGGAHFGQPIDVLTSPPGDPNAVAASAQAQAATFCNSIPGGVKVVQSGPHAGRVYVAWLAADAASNLATGCNLTQMDTFHTVWIAYSDDGGQTWTSQEVHEGGFGHDASALFADLTLDNQGNPYVAFGDDLTHNPGDTTGDWGMYVMGAQVDQAGTPQWKGPFQANDPSQTKTNFFPAIAVGDPGKVDVAYIGSATTTPTLPYGKPTPGGNVNAKWNVYNSQSLNLFSSSPKFTTTQITATPIHMGDVCTLGIFCIDDLTGIVGVREVGTNRGLLDFIDVTIDQHGFAHVAYTDDNTQTGIWAANQISGTPVVAPPKQNTALALTIGKKTISAVLTSGGHPLAGKTIQFFVNGASIGSAVTNSTGTAAVPRPKLRRGDTVKAVFAGDAGYNGSQAIATV